MSQPEKHGAAWPAHYQILVQGILDPHWSALFDGLTITADANGNSMISGQVADQPALYGLISRLRDLGLTLLTVERALPQEKGDQP